MCFFLDLLIFGCIFFGRPPVFLGRFGDATEAETQWTDRERNNKLFPVLVSVQSASFSFGVRRAALKKKHLESSCCFGCSSKTAEHLWVKDFLCVFQGQGIELPICFLSVFLDQIECFWFQWFLSKWVKSWTCVVSPYMTCMTCWFPWEGNSCTGIRKEPELSSISFPAWVIRRPCSLCVLEFTFWFKHSYDFPKLILGNSCHKSTFANPSIQFKQNQVMITCTRFLSCNGCIY